MTDTPAADSTPSDGTPDPSPQTPDGTGTADLGDAARQAISAVRRELRAATEERDAALARVQSYEDATGTELEQLRTKLGRADKRVNDLEAENSALHRRIAASGAAAKYGIPDLAERLQGSTPEELDEDAKALAERMSAAARTSPDLGAGARPSGSAGSSEMDQLIRAKARR